MGSKLMLAIGNKFKISGVLQVVRTSMARNPAILVMVELWPHLNHPEDGGYELLQNVGAIY